MNTEIAEAIRKSDVVIVGAGLTGLTLAERFATQAKLKVLLLEKRCHIGGNAYSEIDAESGIEVHKYGSHIFHTSNSRIWNYVNKFTEFSNYQHRVKTKHNEQIYSFPINLHTINQFLGKSFDPESARKWLEAQTNTLATQHIYNLEEKSISQVGLQLYEAFIRNYTEKQWQDNPRNLPSEIINRIPVRLNYNDKYFNDKYEGLPVLGYAEWFLNMLKSKLIEVKLGVDFFEYKHLITANKILIYTGPIDRFFNYSEGVLGWRTLDLQIENLNIPDFQGTPVMNYADSDVTFTRIHEFKHFYPDRNQSASRTIIMREFSRKADLHDDPYYPIGTEEDRAKLSKYRELIQELTNTYFAGRLGRYQYLDMHMAIGNALALFDQIAGRKDIGTFEPS